MTARPVLVDDRDRVWLANVILAAQRVRRVTLPPRLLDLVDELLTPPDALPEDALTRMRRQHREASQAYRDRQRDITKLAAG